MSWLLKTLICYCLLYHSMTQNANRKNRQYCNSCGYETEHDDVGCVYHQRVLTDSDGATYFFYEEFNQDGEEW